MPANPRGARNDNHRLKRYIAKVHESIQRLFTDAGLDSQVGWWKWANWPILCSGSRLFGASQSW